jgi:DNA-binding response OmpR family regulator
MRGGRVLIIESDEWVTTLLQRFLSGASHQTDVAATAREGFDRAVATKPDLLLVDVSLRDIDGYWVTRRVRAESGRLATTPIILISQRGDSYARLEGLSLGADVFLAAPFRHEEVIAQVEALMGMARRLRTKSDSMHAEGSLGGSDAALHGDVAQISIPTLLTMLELERRTGSVQVRGPLGALATIDLAEGAVVDARLGGKSRPAVGVFRELVTWTTGKYVFEPLAPIDGSRPKTQTSVLLLEATRLNDEVGR